ncbi:MAG TPA: shikimate kinase [Longimicrobium sp.]|nr:shikimate kinase [Longimicrobium sp.]
MPEPVARVVLVGMMGSGKSRVGAELARRLGWQHVDLDRAIERAEGRPIPRIFAEDGEAAFRALEARETARLADRTRMVLAPGGGWVTNPALPASLGPGTLVVWLRVSAAEAARRAAGEPGSRPLLAGGDPVARLEALLAEREPLYARAAALRIDTDGRTPQQVADEIMNEIRVRGLAPS